MYNAFSVSLLFCCRRGSLRRRQRNWWGRYSPSVPTDWECTAKVNGPSLPPIPHPLTPSPLTPSPPHPLSGADIDTLLVAPRHINRDDFFSSFKELLEKEKGVQNVRAIPDAFVPVIKLEYEKIEVQKRVYISSLPRRTIVCVLHRFT